MHQKLLSLALAGLSLMPIRALAAPVPEQPGLRHLVILHTNDTHDHLLPYDAKDAKDVGGVARRATLIARLRAQAPTLVLDAGDNFQGTPLFTFFKGAADFEALAPLHYDAFTVGNHDLDLGIANLRTQVARNHIPIICSDLADPHGHLFFPSYRIFDVDHLKVGVFGILGVDAWQAVAKSSQSGVQLLDPVKVARRLVPQLRRQCDLVVMLSHSGLTEDEAFAKEVPGIDVIVGGHSHTEVDHPIPVQTSAGQTLVLQAYAWGRYLGKLDLWVGHHRVVSYAGELLPIDSGIPADPRVAAIVDRYASRVASQMAQVVGANPALIDREAPAGWADSPLGDWAADLVRRHTGADVGIMNEGGLRADLLPGPVTVGEIFDIFPFQNALVTEQMSGAVLANVVRESIADTRHRGSENLQFSGLTFAVKDGQAIALRVDGVPLDPTRVYRVGTIDYLAAGNDRHATFLQATDAHPLGVVLRDAVLAELRAHPRVHLEGPDRIRWE